MSGAASAGISTPVFADGVKTAIDQAIAAIPSGKRGHAAIGLTPTGAEAEIGVRVASWLDLGGYAKKLWGGGWTAGARAQAAW